MGVEVLCAQWLNRCVLSQWYPSLWVPARVTRILDDGKHVWLDYDAPLTEGSIKTQSCVSTSDLGVYIQLAGSGLAQ